MAPIQSQKDLAKAVRKAVDQQPVFDVHTHLYDTNFGGLLLWGIDEVLTYHYLVAEVMRYCGLSTDKFWQLDKKAQADLIWDRLFIKNSPLSEATRGILTCLDRLGVNLKNKSLDKARAYFKGRKAAQYIETVFEAANLEALVMTNNPFDPLERPVWDKGPRLDPRFKAALRIDNLLTDWPAACKTLKELGYKVTPNLAPNVFGEIRRFLGKWIDRMEPVYMAASLPPTFDFPAATPCGKIIEHAIAPVSRERAVPFAMMIGVKKQINPALRLAGDGVGRSDVAAVERLCAAYPDNKFLVTMLSRENQHELCVVARKFRNLMVFGCWWFLNNPSLVREMTLMRMETLGTSFIPQHSDARVLDQLIYKWVHSREVIADVLIDKYAKVMANGWPVTKKDIRHDVENLLAGNFKRFVGK